RADIVEAERNCRNRTAGVEWIKKDEPVVTAKADEVVAPRLAGIVHDLPRVDVAALLQKVLNGVGEHFRSFLWVQWEIDSESSGVDNVAEKLRTLHEETA